MTQVHVIHGGDTREPWVSARSLAEYLGVSVFTIRRMAKRGMPSRRVAGQLRFRVSAADDWIDEDQEGSHA